MLELKGSIEACQKNFMGSVSVCRTNPPQKSPTVETQRFFAFCLPFLESRKGIVFLKVGFRVSG